MPAQGVATIAVAGVLALALVVAVTVILVQLRRTSAVLADVDGLLAGLPPGLAGLGPTISRITRAIGSLRA